MLVALLLLTPSVSAQDPVPAVAPAPPVVPLKALSESYVWVRRGQPDVRVGLDDVAIDPLDGATWLVVDETGGVWRSADGGATWAPQLRGRRVVQGDDTSGDERLLLDAEAAQDEELSRVTVDAPASVDDTEADSTSAQASQDAAELAGQAARVARPVVDTPCRVWFDPSEAGVALLGRPDGVWRSADGGQAWERVDEELGAAEFYRWGGVLVIGGADGIRASLDGGYSYLDLGGVAQGATVYQFVGAGTDLYAATSAGLFRSPDGLHWVRVLAAGQEAVRTVVPDASWAGGLWIAGESGVRRSDDGGQSFYTAGTQPLRGLRRMIPLLGQGHLLVIGADGVWESMDGGVRWVLASRLLTEPDVRGIALRDGLPVIATANGVWQVEEPKRVVEEVRPPPAGLSLGDVVDLSIHRAGLNQDALSLSHRTALLMIVPTLQVDGSVTTGHSRDSDYLLLQTSEARDYAWSANLQLCWGGCGVSYTTAYSDTYGDALSDVLGNDNLSVINGEVYDDTAIVAAAANVSQAMSAYRMTVANGLAEAWLTRQRLAAEAPLLADRPIAEQVTHLLKIQELDARMDAWTDGAWTESLQETPEVR